MSVISRRFTRREIADILAAHLGGTLTGVGGHDDGGLSIWAAVNEPEYVARFYENVQRTMIFQRWGRSRAHAWVLETDWIAALKEQASRNSAVDRTAQTVPDESACGSLCEGVPTKLQSHVHVTPTPLPKTLTPIDDSAERHRAKRANHAERVCKKHGAFDWEAIPYAETERLNTRQRLERLEAAVMEMACHDPTGPFASARDFLSLRVSKGLSKLLGRTVYTT